MSVKYRINGRTYYEVVCDDLPFESKFSNYGKNSDIIAIYNDNVVIVRSHFNEILNIDDIRCEYNEISERVWLDNDIKNKVIDYYKNLINLALFYQRDLKINKLIDRCDINWISLAC